MAWLTPVYCAATAKTLGMNWTIVGSCSKNTKRTASSRKYHSRGSFKWEAPLKGSLIGGAESEGSIPNVDSGEKIEAEALQVKFEIMKQAVASILRVNLQCMGRKLASLLDSKSMVSLVQKLFWPKHQTRAGTSQRTGGLLGQFIWPQRCKFWWHPCHKIFWNGCCIHGTCQSLGSL